MMADTLGATEVIPGYLLLERLGAGRTGEVWKCAAPGRVCKALRLVHGPLLPAAGLERIKDIRHPFLLTVDRFDVIDGRLVIVMELAERTLWDRFQQCRTEALPGIPRVELLHYLSETAEALDVLNGRHQLQHLGIKPQHLFLVHDHIKVSECGLSNEPTGTPLGLAVRATTAYTAPELLDGLVSAAADQYSLAIVYQELLTGHRPGTGQDQLPAADRPVLARALARAPSERFPSCRDLVRALRASATAASRVRLEPASAVAEPSDPDDRTRLTEPTELEIVTTPVTPAPGATGLPTPEEFVRDLVRRAIPDGAEEQQYEGLRCVIDADGVLHHQCAAWLPEDVAWKKLEGFLRQWRAQRIERDDDGLRAQLPLQTSLWQRLNGAPTALELDLRWQRRPGVARMSEITIQLCCPSARREQSRRVLDQLGPNVLNSLRSYFMATAENRTHSRFPFAQPLRFGPWGCADHTAATDGRGEDISLGGVRFHAPRAPETAEICLFFPVNEEDGLEGVAVPVKARVRQVVPAPRGGFLVGAQFELDPIVQGRRILLIDEDPNEADRLDSLLCEVTGLTWELQSVAQLAQGVQALRAGGIDVVLLDLSMPQVRDWDALRQIRTAAPGVPVIVLAERQQTGLAMQAIQEGASDYLFKSQLDCTQLARTLHGAVERQRARQDRDLKNERQRMLAELEKGRQKEHYLAYHDALTGLPNRALFYDRLTQALEHAKRQSTQAAVMFLDLDGFKRINDTLGHSTGDRLLQAVAERLKECVRKSDTVARLGGDEFTIILTNLNTPDAAVQVADKVLRLLARPVVIDNQELFVTTSIGISVFPVQGADVESLVKQADAAMYRAKNQGKNNFQVYHDGLNDDTLDDLTLENELRKAIDRGELVLHYQPQVELRTRSIVGVEALVRWQHPQHGLLGPNKFIPLAEETGLIVPLGEWVLRTACAQNRAWQVAGHKPLRMCVNLSSRQFRDNKLADTVVRTLTETGLPPNLLGVEITESCAIQDVDYTIRMLRGLKDKGIQVLIDDFGTGYSSLNYLKHFPIDVLKIEQSFIKGIPHDRGDVAITTAVIGLAHSLDLKVIAEHVDTEDQLAFLQSLQCDELQSYLFSPPLPSAALTKLLTNADKSPSGRHRAVRAH